MDCKPEDLQFLGFIGIMRESLKLLSSKRRLFSQITAALVIPILILRFAQQSITSLALASISADANAAVSSPPGSAAQSSALSHLSATRTEFLVFEAFYFLAVIALRFLCTAAVVYCVASLYTGLELTFRQVLKAAPKVWLRLVATFIWYMVLFFAFNFAAAAVLLALYVILTAVNGGLYVAFFVYFLVVFTGLVYIAIIANLANVVSVLEDVRGIAALRRSKALIKGKMAVAVAINLVLSFCYVGMELGLRKLMAKESGGGGDGGLVAAVARVGLGLALVAVQGVVSLVILVSDGVLYFVCKSQHHERIDMVELAGHLEVYLVDEYLPLKPKDVQLDRSPV